MDIQNVGLNTSDYLEAIIGRPTLVEKYVLDDA